MSKEELKRKAAKLVGRKHMSAFELLLLWQSTDKKVYFPTSVSVLGYSL